MSRGYQYRDDTVTSGVTVTKVLVVINVIVYVILAARGDTQDTEYMFRCGALWVPSVLEDLEIYRLLTSAFLHFSFLHLFNNMLLLFFMGDVLEDAVGGIRFLIVYLLSGIAGNLITLLLEVHTGEYSLSAGASGAVFGVLGALLCLLILNRGRVSYLTGGRIAFFVLYSLFTGFTSSGVNNAAHVGGLLAGFVLALISRPAGSSGED